MVEMSGSREKSRDPRQHYIWGPYDVIIFKNKNTKNRRTVLQSVENASERGPQSLAPILMGPCSI